MSGYRNSPIKQIASQDLSAAALSDTYVMKKDGYFHWAGLKASVGITETAVVTFDSVDGVNYDIVLKSTDLGGGSNFFYNVTNPIFLKKGDAIKISCTNANTTGVVYSTMCIEEVETYA